MKRVCEGNGCVVRVCLLTFGQSGPMASPREIRRSLQSYNNAATMVGARACMGIVVALAKRYSKDQRRVVATNPLPTD